ncbi:MAG TPA: hypothetical protein VNO33_14940 [Kofleriaceae bacterium]|nr:hypothetical protein [Kofleriaceae bacterium]
MSTTPELGGASLFASSLPEAWRPLVEAVTELAALAAEQTEKGEYGKAERKARAAGLRARILGAASERVEVSPSVLAWGSELHRRWFSEAVLLWTYFADASGRVRIDMLGAPELGGFPVDLPAEPGARAKVRAGLVAGLGWSEEELAGIERGLEHRLSNLAVKRAITAEIARRLQAGGEAAAVELMRSVYGDLPLRPGDVAPIVTATAIFFCLPLTQDGLDRPGYGERPAGERAAIGDFVVRLHKAATSLKNVRFPAFGLFDRNSVAPRFYADLAAAVSRDPALAAVDERIIAETFPTMALLIPSGEAGKYLVHDSWGHAWQESLCEFEWLFGDFEEMSASLDAGALRPGFRDDGGRTAVDEPALERAVDADLRRRIAIGLNLMIAEALADFVEHKLARRGDPLPSSSLLPEAILRLDLSCIDAARVARLWSRPYRQLTGSAEARQQLAGNLARLGLPAAGLPEAIDQALALIAARFGAALPGLPVETPGRVAVDLTRRAVLGMATLEAALDQLLRRGEERLAARPAGEPRWRSPAACIDLIAVLVGWFYDQDPELHIWHLDELVARELWPALLALEAGMDSR